MLYSIQDAAILSMNSKIIRCFIEIWLFVNSSNNRSSLNLIELVFNALEWFCFYIHWLFTHCSIAGGFGNKYKFIPLSWSSKTIIPLQLLNHQHMMLSLYELLLNFKFTCHGKMNSFERDGYSTYPFIMMLRFGSSHNLLYLTSSIGKCMVVIRFSVSVRKYLRCIINA
jgi:hypothetical protein